MRDIILADGLERILTLELARVTEAAAIAAYEQIGRGNENDADQAAVDAMRKALNQCNFDGTVVIGEGERDEAPMLFIGEKVGTGKGPKVDIALDPLEGTTLTAKAMANALAVVAVAEGGSLLNSPDTYMDKIAIGGGYPEGVVDLDADPRDNILALAKAKGVPPREITACILDRSRHSTLIAKVREAGAAVALISDGDIAGVIHCAKPETGIDMYLGSGGAPEGVLAAAALKCVGGQFQGRLVLRNDEERIRAKQAGIEDLKRRYELNDLVSGAAVFIATGVTSGSLLEGVRISRGEVQTHTMVLNCASGASMELKTRERVQ